MGESNYQLLHKQHQPEKPWSQEQRRQWGQWEPIGERQHRRPPPERAAASGHGRQAAAQAWAEPPGVGRTTILRRRRWGRGGGGNRRWKPLLEAVSEWEGGFGSGYRIMCGVREIFVAVYVSFGFVWRKMVGVWIAGKKKNKRKGWDYWFLDKVLEVMIGASCTFLLHSQQFLEDLCTHVMLLLVDLFYLIF